MSPLETAKPTEAQFDSLAALRAAHAELLQSVPDQGLTEADAARVQEFLRKGAAAGALMDNPEDRKGAQGLLDYWRATLYAESRDRGAKRSSAPPTHQRLADAVLAPFDEGTVRGLAEKAEALVRGFSPKDQELTRRLLLRVVYLAPNRRGFDPNPITRSALEALGVPAQVDHIVDQLTGLGVLRVEKGGTAGDRYGLAYEALTRSWDRLRTWLDQRLRFRDTVKYWEKHDRNPNALISDVLLDEARDYHDKNELEEAFVKDSRQREKHQTRNYRMLTIVFATLALVVAGLAVTAYGMYRHASTEADSAIKEKAKADVSAAAAIKSETAAEESAQALKLKQELFYLERLTRYLAEVATAQSAAEQEIADERWKKFIETALQDEQFAPIKKQFDFVAVLKQAGNEKYQKLSGETISKIKALRNPALANDAARSNLESIRVIAYALAELSAQRTAEVLEDGTYADAEPYITEFWTLYWGQMILVESHPVDLKMVEYGRVLIEIREELEGDNTDHVKKVAEIAKQYSDDKNKKRFLDMATQLTPKLYSQFRQDFKKEISVKDLNQLIEGAAQRKVKNKNLSKKLQEAGKALKDVIDAELKANRPVQPDSNAQAL